VKPFESTEVDRSVTGEYRALATGDSSPGLYPLPVGVRVLVADDDLRVCRAIASSLGRMGFDVKVASDGGPAIESAEKHHPDLALVDYSMPQSGLEVARAIKGMYGASTHVCILSGNDSEEIRLAAFDAGADDFLGKPMSILELRRRMVAAARKQQAYIEARLAREQADRLLAWGTEASALLAHDLNNGLAVALSNISYLISVLELAPDDRQAMLSTQRALRRMSGLVANFVDIARFEDDALRPRPGTVAIADLLNEVMEVHAPTLGRDIRHSVTCPPGLEGYFDEALMMRVLHNLVGNAARYCNTGGTISLAASAATPDMIELVVFNSGPSIPTELAAKLFTKYALGRGGQRGLGLYFCRLACEAQGGTAHHRADADGPAFVLRVPRAIAHSFGANALAGTMTP